MSSEILHRMAIVTDLLKLRVNIWSLKDLLIRGPALAHKLQNEIARIEDHKARYGGDMSNGGFLAQLYLFPECRHWMKKIDHDALLAEKYAELEGLRVALVRAPKDLEWFEEMLGRAHALADAGCASGGGETRKRKREQDGDVDGEGCMDVQMGI